MSHQEITTVLQWGSAIAAGISVAALILVICLFNCNKNIDTND